MEEAILGEVALWGFPQGFMRFVGAMHLTTMATWKVWEQVWGGLAGLILHPSSRLNLINLSPSKIPSIGSQLSSTSDVWTNNWQDGFLLCHSKHASCKWQLGLICCIHKRSIASSKQTQPVGSKLIFLVPIHFQSFSPRYLHGGRALQHTRGCLEGWQQQGVPVCHTASACAAWWGLWWSLSPVFKSSDLWFPWFRQFRHYSDAVCRVLTGR